MRALLVCAAPVPGSVALVAALAPSFDLLVGVDGGAAVFAHAGVMPDLIVGDMDSLAPEAADEYERQGVAVSRFSADKANTDLDLAIDAARHAGASSVTVSGAAAGRLDHTLAVAGSLARNADLAPRIEDPALRGWLLSRGGRSSLTLTGLGSTVSIFSVLGAARLSCTGLKWPLLDHRLDPLSSLGVSNVLVENSGHVEVHEGDVLVLSPEVADARPAAETL